MLTLLILGLTIVIIKIIMEIIRQYHCQSDQTIRAYMRNELNPDQRAAFTTHLGLCNKCQQRLHDYNFADNTSDHLISE